MINVNDFKTGVTIEYDGNIYSVIEFQHVKPGKGSAFVRTKLRNIRTGAVIDNTFNSGIKVKKAHIEKTQMQYLYLDGTDYQFMNMETYDQIAIPTSSLEYEGKFLIDGSTVDVIQYENEIVGVLLPDKVVLKIVDTPPGEKGNTAANATKEATCETGLVIKVPLFINNDEKVIVSTQDGSYVSRA
ncbi:MAG: elongation factor P [Bacilli bacterium]